MQRLFLPLSLLSILVLTTYAAHAGGQPDKAKAAPAIAKLIQGSAQDFIKNFDKDKDGYLSKNELPERLQVLFDRFDKNGDSKLDKEEVAEMLKVLRQQIGKPVEKPGD